ncbi:MAG TPA: AMP-binding protein, partial [Terriglobia bacterium]|nr:AMP-binding protein [Terriglobia bacterium]
MDETNHRPLTPISFLERSARVFADRTAVVDHDRRLTYREFHERARSMAAGLEAIGIQPGDRVAFLALNGETLLTAHFGVPMSGAVLVAINTRLARNEFVYILNHSEAAALVVDPALLPDFNELRAECPSLRTVITPGKDYDAFLARGSHRRVAHELKDEDALISLNYTSGTSGYLKGVMYTHRGAYLNAIGNAIEVELTSTARYLWTLP